MRRYVIQFHSQFLLVVQGSTRHRWVGRDRATEFRNMAVAGWWHERLQQEFGNAVRLVEVAP
jgi:hypothetical protein